MTQIAPTRSATRPVASSSPPVKPRVSPLLVLLAITALGLAGARLVSMFEPEGSDPVSPAAHAATPATPAALAGTDRGTEHGAQGDAQPWAAAFGRFDATAPAPEPEPVAASEPAPEPTAPKKEPEPRESTQYWLTGLIRGDSAHIALVHDGVEEQVATVGSHLSGGETVIRIDARSLLIRRDGGTETIVFREQPGPDGAISDGGMAIPDSGIAIADESDDQAWYEARGRDGEDWDDIDGAEASRGGDAAE